jgi:predicted component of type VI protein secretion system
LIPNRRFWPREIPWQSDKNRYLVHSSNKQFVHSFVLAINNSANPQWAQVGVTDHTDCIETMWRGALPILDQKEFKVQLSFLEQAVNQLSAGQEMSRQPRKGMWRVGMFCCTRTEI